MDTPILWQFTFSHFNEKARWALDYKRIAHVRRSLLPGPHLPKVMAMTGQTSVPVLIMNRETILDSTRIIGRLEHTNPAPALYPADPEQRGRALDLEEFFDEQLGPYDRQWFFDLTLDDPDYLVLGFCCEASEKERSEYRAGFPALAQLFRQRLRINPPEVEVARKMTMAALDRIESELQPSGYLVGNQFSVADLTAAALLAPLVDPPEFPYRISVPAPKGVIEARESIAARPAIRYVREMYRRHRGRSAEVRE